MPRRRDPLASAARRDGPRRVYRGAVHAPATPTPDPNAGTPAPTLGTPRLSSPAFDQAGTTPAQYARSGEGRSPPLVVSEVPEGAETFALVLVMDDPDAGVRPYVHWMVCDAPVGRTEWPAGVPNEETVEELDGVARGRTPVGRWGYRETVGDVGPCPPSDGAHTDRFALYALGTSLGADPGADRSAAGSAIRGERYGVPALRGTYDR